MESCPSRTSAGSESGLRALAILFLVPGKLGKTISLLSLFQGRRTLEHTLFLSSPSLPTSWGSLGWSRRAKLQKAAGVCPKASRRSRGRTQRAWGLTGESRGAQGLDSLVGVPVALQPTRQVVGRAKYLSADLYLSMRRCPGLCAGLLAHLRLPTPPSLHFLATVYTRYAACFFSPLGRVWSLTG